MAKASPNTCHLFLENILKTIKYDLKQNIISCGTVRTLQSILFNKIAGKLWINIGNEIDDFLSSMQFYHHDSDKWLENMAAVEDKVVENAFRLIIPNMWKEALKPIIHSLGFEITIYLFTQMHLYFYNWNNLKVYWNSLVFTDEGNINQLKTAIKLLENKNLSNEQKYIVACNNCLEDKIREIHQKLPLDFISNITKQIENYEGLVRRTCSSNIFHLVLYWTFYVRGELERFSEITKPEEINVFILKWAILYRNEVAVQYIWETFADEEIKEKLFDFIHCSKMNIFKMKKFRRPNSCNILLYLLKQKSNISIRDLDEIIHSKLIWIFNRISKQRDLPEMDRAYELIRMDNVPFTLHQAMYCWYEDILSIKQYERFFEDFELRFKTDIEFDLVGLFDVLFYFFYRFDEVKEDMISLKLLMKTICNLHQRETLFVEQGIRACVILLKHEELDTFRGVINSLLKTEEERMRFKEGFFNNNCILFCAELIFKGKYDFLNKILTYFSSENSASLKRELIYKENASIVLNVINRCIYNNFDLLSFLNNVLNLVFDKQEYEILRCKTLIFGLENDVYHDHVFSFCKKVKQLIKNRKWDLVEKYWRWIFVNAEGKLRSVKEIIVHIKNILYLISRKGCCGLFKRFVTSCFEYDEVQDIRKELACSEKLLLSLVDDMLKYDKHEKAEELIQWCHFDVKSEIDKFKKKFMFSYGCETLYNIISEENVETIKLKSLFLWFSPSFKTAKLFEDVFIDFSIQKSYDFGEHKNISSCKELQKRTNESLELLSAFVVEKNIIEETSTESN